MCIYIYIHKQCPLGPGAACDAPHAAGDALREARPPGVIYCFIS